MVDKSGVGRNAISLPKGGGAVPDQSETFKVDQLRGTVSYSIPIVLPKARGKLRPNVDLRYSSDAGFGSIGLGWSIGIPSVQRRTDAGVPTYNDDEDVFTFLGEELLRTGAGEYRARIEQNFRRITRSSDGWQVRDRNGNLYVLGETPDSRLYNPAAPSQILAWMIERMEDTHGNIVRYSYRRDLQTVSPAPAISFQAAQLYLDRVEYNPHQGGWLSYVAFSYDFSTSGAPPRSDAHRSYRPGFPVFTAWRLSKIETFCDFPGKFSGPVRSYDLRYDADPGTGLSLLSEVQARGYDDDGNSELLPAVTMSYSEFGTSGSEVQALEGAPQIDLADGDVELVDLTGNGLPDLLRTQPGSHTFWLNNQWRLPSNVALGEMHFASGTAMSASPNIALTQPSTHLADVRGKVAADLLSGTAVMDSPSISVTHADVLAKNLSWGTQSVFSAPPPFNFSDGKARIVDLTGRGRMDVLRADGGSFRHWLNKADGSYEDRGLSAAVPGADFNNPEWTFADLSGDGLADLVRVQNGRIEYYPNRGTGHRSGALFELDGIVMGNGISLRQGVTQWSPERMIFIDLNGNGLDDLVYLHSDRLHYWLNKNGTGWSDRSEILFSEGGAPVSLKTDRRSVRVGDLLGRGSSGLLWSSVGTAMRYLPISSEQKALLLRTIDNGVGGRYSIEYRSSTRSGGDREWTTRIPFVLHVVHRISREDLVTGDVETTEYFFSDGQFDRERREFIGFGEVRIVEHGDDSGAAAAPCRTRITSLRHHVLPDTSVDPIERALSRALAGSLCRKSEAGLGASQPQTVAETLFDTTIVVDYDDASQSVFGTNGLSPRDVMGNPVPEPVVVALPTHMLRQTYDASNLPAGIDRNYCVSGRLEVKSYRDATGNLDPYGRVLSTVTADDLSIGAALPAENEVLLTVDPGSELLRLSSDTSAVKVSAPSRLIRRGSIEYALNAGQHLVAQVSRATTRSSGKVIEEVRNYFDGSDYVGLPLGKIQSGNLMRQEVLVLRDDQVDEFYVSMPGGPPDPASLGYRRAEYGTRRSWFRAYPCRPLLRPAPWRWWHNFTFWPRLIVQRVVELLFCRPEGHGWFVDRNRYRYAMLPDGSRAYGLYSGVKDALGRETTIEYDSFFLMPESQSDPSGNTLHGQGDYRVGKMSSVTDVNGHVESNVYDAFGRIAMVVKPGDSVAKPTTSWEYSPPGGPLPVFVRTRLRKDSGSSSTFDSTEYRNGWNQPLQTRVEAEGGQYKVSGAVRYNPRGGLRERVLPYFDPSADYAGPSDEIKRFRYFVDELDRDYLIEHPDGSQVQREYLGTATEESDREDLHPGSAHQGTPTRFVRDSRNNLVQVHQRLAGSTVVAHYEFDVLNKLVSVRLSGGSTGRVYCQYRHDLLGRRLVITHEDAEPAYTVLNASGQVVKSVDARGRTTEVEYDHAGRISRRVFPTLGEPAIVYEYCDASDACDPARNIVGRIAKVIDAHGEVEFDYDERGRLGQHRRTWDEFGSSTTYAVTFEYDSADRMRSRLYPQVAGAVAPIKLTNRYDSGNLLDGVDLESGGTTSALISKIDYDPRGQRSSVEFGNGLSSQFEYDDTRLHLRSITTTNTAGTKLQDLRYCHDREGNLTLRLDRAQDKAFLYKYDALYRLVDARELDITGLGPLPDDCEAIETQLSGMAAVPQLYEYSPEGDIERFGSPGPMSYAPRDGRPRGEIVLGTKRYLFDSGGALERVVDVTDSSIIHAEYDYDSRGRLARVKLPPADLRVEYAYDYEGARVGKRMTQLSDDAVVSETRWLGRWLSFHRDSAGPQWDRVRQYVFDDGKPWVVLDRAGQVLSVVHPDHLGSSDLIADAAGNALCTLSYGPFGGELTPTSCADLRHRYNGKETDHESGLVDYGVRHYLPSMGRWISPDPVLGTKPENYLQNPQSLNAYAYAVNNPVTLIDPVGKSPGKYAGSYIDTGTIVTRQVIVDGKPQTAYYRVVESIPGTWLSKVTYDHGFSRLYSKEQGYGAYDRAIVFPLSNAVYSKGVHFDPDKIGTGERFGVLIAPVERVEFTEGSTIVAPRPESPQEQSSGWTPDAITVSISGALFSPQVVGGGGGIEFVYIFGKGWVIYGQVGIGGGVPGGGVSLEVGPVWNLKEPSDYTKHFIEIQGGSPPVSGSVFFWPEGAYGAKAGVYGGSPGVGAMYEHYFILKDFTSKDE